MSADDCYIPLSNMSSSSSDNVGKSSKGVPGQDEQDVERIDSPEMATEVIEVDAAYLASSASTKFYRGVLFQMILLYASSHSRDRSLLL